ncbi:MAG: ribosome biogenesis GTPase Der [SAR202 cluster bacterium]|nr:ribosome biogenesis GTPase Der [SAR202 cluster bacterium]
MPNPIIAIVGRPNAGKSSLFNRILGQRHAIVSDVAGTTRDRLMAEAQWEAYKFILVDTGGLEPDPQGPIQQKVQEQARMAMDDADVIIFLTDVTEGLTPIDLEVAARLRRTHKPVILAVNKVDNPGRELSAAEFYQLGMADTFMISAFHNLGVADLMDKVVSYLPPPPEPEPEPAAFEIGAGTEGGAEPEGIAFPPPPKELKLAIVGRTNVGKSMLVNAILGEERCIVSDVAGTTRDALDTPIQYQGHTIVLIDTAGIRRPGRVELGIEKYSVIRSVNALARCDIALLVTDATELATAQDAHIAGLAWDMVRGLIVVVNKWDLAPKDESLPAAYPLEHALARVRSRLHFMSYVPVCFTSALTGQGVDSLLQTALALWQERMRRVPYRALQRLLVDALSDHPPPMVKGHHGQRLRVDMLRQVDVNPPTFLFTVNNPHLVHFSYERYLENRLRETFGFNHSHLRLVFKTK